MSDVGVFGFEPSWGSEEVSASPRPSCMIVEDQALIALSLEAYLEEMGLDVGEPLMSIARRSGMACRQHADRCHSRLLSEGRPLHSGY